MRHVIGFTQGRRESICASWHYPTREADLYLPVRRAHLQMIQRRAADQQGPPKVDITQFGWEVKGGIPSPCVDSGLPASQGFIDVINCGCKSEGKAYNTESCNYHKNNMSCTVYCARFSAMRLLANWYKRNSIL